MNFGKAIGATFSIGFSYSILILLVLVLVMVYQMSWPNTKILLVLVMVYQYNTNYSTGYFLRWPQWYLLLILAGKPTSTVTTKGENINICWSPDGHTIAVGNKVRRHKNIQCNNDFMIGRLTDIHWR